MKKLIYSIMAFMLLFSSCHKDEYYESQSQVNNQIPEIINATQGLIYGIVVDEANQPIDNVTITSYGINSHTDQKGVFKLTDALLSPTGTYITAEKEGYFLGSDVVYSVSKTGYTKIRLIEKKDYVSINPKDNQSINIGGSAELFIPKYAFANAENELYEEDVKFYTGYYDSGIENFDELNVGGSLGMDSEDRTVVLNSKNLLMLEARGVNNEKLKLLEGKAIIAKLPIDINESSSIAKNIDTWFFDINTGYWMKKGEAHRVDNIYEAEIDQLQPWSYAQSYSIIRLQGNFKSQNGHPLKYCKVYLDTQLGNLVSGYTDNEGNFCGFFAKNELLSLSASFLGCNKKAYAQTFNVQEKDIDLGTLKSDKSISQFSGGVYCEDALVPDSYIILNNGHIIYAEDGKFDYYGELCNSDEYVSTIFMTAISGNEYSSEPYELIYESQDPDNEIVFQVCNNHTCSFTVDITSNIHEVCSSSEVFISAVVTGEESDYDFRWMGGETESTIQVALQQDSSIFCVDVTEKETGCTISECKSFDLSSIGVQANIYGEYSCLENIGFVTIKILRGLAPFHMQIENTTVDEIISESSEEEYRFYYPDLFDDIYNVIITDSQNCTYEQSITLNKTFDFEIYRDSLYCDDGEIKVDITGENFIYENNTFLELIHPDNPSYITVRKELSHCNEFNLEVIDNSAVDNFEVYNTTCDTCKDGYITWDNATPYIYCLYCNIFKSFIYRVDEIETGNLFDYTLENESRKLSKGDYVLIGTTDDMCVVARKTFTIE